MFVWRLTRRTHADDPLSGEGARRYGGRWNHIGVPIVYASESLSLAVLEYLVNLPLSDLPADLVSIQIEIPGTLPRTEISIDDLPDNWRTFPATDELKEIGTDWAQQAKTAILVLPSVVIPNERNFLLNPSHALARKFVVISIQSFTLDDRLQGGPRAARR